MLWSCQHSGTSKGTGKTDSTQATTETWTTYTGTLPCADCSGILTVLSLQEQSPAGEHPFKLKETYQGVNSGKDQTFNSEGNYVVLSGTPSDKSAVIIQLNPDKDQNLQRFFQKVGEKELKQLDKDKRIVESSLNYSLKSSQ